MKLKKCKYMVCSLAIAGLLVAGMLWLLNGVSHVARAANGVRYVAPGGDDGGQCDSIANRCRTVQRALDVADPFDEIRVATGIYTGAAGTVAAINETVALLGGWDDGFTTRDPNAYPTTLDAQRNGRVVYIFGSISPTIDGFTITHGNANGESIGTGMGGGIYSSNASPIIQNNVIVSNTASISPTSGSGGGVYLHAASASALISGNQVLSNTAHSTSWDEGGGGLYLSHSDATVQGNLIQGNTCNRAGGGIYVGCCGAPRILSNEIRSNESDLNGGGIYARYSDRPRVEGNLIINNVAAWNGGGGMMVNYGSPTITANRIFSNTGSGAVGLQTGDYFTVTNNFIAHNDNGGIRLWELTRYGLVAHNTIAFNGGEGGIRLRDPHITPTLVNNIIIFNTYGISAHENASGTLDYNDVWGNTTQDYDLPGALEPGVHDIQADPLFASPAGDDYHLQASSPCVDAGTDAGVTSDIDGDPRPLGSGYDIGADEFIATVYLPLMLRNH